MFRETSRISEESSPCGGLKIAAGEFAMPKAFNYAHWFLEPYCIGTKLRALRTQKRLTLSRLAGETGLSTALLSKLETDRMVPTLPTLAIISRVYGVGMSYFFSEPGQHSVSITRKAHLEANGRGTDAVKTTPLHAISEADRIAARVIEFTPGAAGTATEDLENGSGVMYVLEGTLQIEAGGMNETLATGDCAYLHSKMTMAMSAAGKHRCRVLAVTPVTAQGAL